jgi:hypothetical protein
MSRATVFALLVFAATAEAAGAQADWPFGQRLLAPPSGDQKAPLIFRGVTRPPATLDVEAPPLVVATRPALRTSEAIDCAMVKPVTPNFHSAMPIVSPDSRVDYALRIVSAPACRTQTEARQTSGR